MKNCPTFPILLIHGAGYENEFPIPYWGRIPKTLEEYGCKVYLGHTKPWDLMERNAKRLAIQIKNILQKENTNRINLIGHSRGGLEARICPYMGIAENIGSITTICSPHRGCDFIEELSETFKFQCYNYVVDGFWRYIRKSKYDVKACILEMTPEEMEKFNKKYPNFPHIYYQSYGALIEEYRGDWPRYILYRILAKTGENNDGMVSPESAMWGEYKATLRHCSHQYLADTFRLDDGGVEVPTFYINIVKDLAQRGF